MGIRENRRNGKKAEEAVRENYKFRGYEVKRISDRKGGADFKVSRKNWITGRNESKYVEVKYTTKEETPCLSKKQRETQKKKKKYATEILRPPFY